jgi:Na+/H+ antiporter NhaC
MENYVLNDSILWMFLAINMFLIVTLIVYVIAYNKARIQSKDEMDTYITNIEKIWASSEHYKNQIILSLHEQISLTNLLLNGPSEEVRLKLQETIKRIKSERKTMEINSEFQNIEH